MADNSVDAIVTDPPYGLSFMGKRWDYDVPSVELWAECLRVLKPGGHLLAFAGTRTQHRMAVRIEDAGFEIRDMIAWVYGSGFPKSLDIGKAIDKAAGVERKVIGIAADFARDNANRKTDGSHAKPTQQVAKNDRWSQSITTPATDAAKQWDGWGSALKPALEPITLARKPLDERTIAANVLTWSTGGVNVNGCRIDRGAKTGGFPANFIHDGSDEVVRLFPVTTSGDIKAIPYTNTSGKNVFGKQTGIKRAMKGDTGSAARFFYCAKAPRSEREAGLEGVEARQKVFNGQSGESAGMAPGSVEDKFTTRPSRNHHPTVKPITLMRYLCRLVTPPGGIVLDPFAGSGTTGCAAILEGFEFIGLERDEEYAKIAEQRIVYWASQSEEEKKAVLPLFPD